MNKKSKSMKKMLTYGILLVIPIVLLLSYWFTELKMPDMLSIFLIVLIGGAVIFAYYLIYTRIEAKNEEKNKNKPDPFAD
jgi:uncharacterized membrane protein